MALKILKEFEEFATRGNVIDLAVGVIIGGAFSKIVDSAVKDLFMPIVSLALGKLDFSNFFIVLGHLPENTPNNLEEIRKLGIPVLAYGSFITILINFIILAFIIFIMIKQINRVKRKISEHFEEEQKQKIKEIKISEDILLLREIRDNLQKLNNK